MYKKAYYMIYPIGGHNTNPSDSTTYYVGAPTRPLTTIAKSSRIKILKTGTIVSAYLKVMSSTEAGSNEAWPFVIRLNDTTDYTFASVSAAATEREWENYALNIPVTAGDYIEFKTITPAWATNPTSCYVEGVVMVRY